MKKFSSYWLLLMLMKVEELELHSQFLVLSQLQRMDTGISVRFVSLVQKSFEEKEELDCSVVVGGMKFCLCHHNIFLFS